MLVYRAAGVFRMKLHLPIVNSNSKITFQWAVDYQRIRLLFVGFILDFSRVSNFEPHPQPPGFDENAEVEGRSGLELESRA